MDAVRVVAGVDFSAISPAVVGAAARLAGKLGGQCVVVHAVEALRGGEEEGPLLPGLRRWVEQVRDEARDALNKLIGAEHGSAVRGEVLDGRAFSGLIQRARELQARCLVLGGPHPGGLLGTTAERVVRKSPLPVLVVRRPPQDGYRRLLVGVDFSSGAERAMEQAASLAEPDAVLTVCHVLNTWGSPSMDGVDAATTPLLDRLAEWAKQRLPGREPACLVAAGIPKTELLTVAESVQADLIVVGCRGKSRLSHMLLGSVAEAAVRRARCDVLVVGEPREDFCLP
ncbi:MAG: universal stress protein [Deferrisomatales bacterium]|nr:universal stress protein [Deferrisomatales bacterium]